MHKLDCINFRKFTDYVKSPKMVEDCIKNPRNGWRLLTSSGML